MGTTDSYGDRDSAEGDDAEPFLASIQRFPVKSLDPERRERATLTGAGALVGDREWAILDRPAGEFYDPTTADVSGTGDYVNGKKTDAIHRIRSRFHTREEGGPAVTLREETADPSDARRFDLYAGRDGKRDGQNGSNETRLEEAAVHAEINEWLTAYFDRPVSVRWEGVGHHDDRTRHGPTVVSTATLREAASWFDFDLDSARRRFRANLEVGGVPPFWEDRLFDDEGRVVAFRIGDAVIEGVHPCQRCVVPSRDPDTGSETEAFRETFIRKRRETLPSWTESDRFDHPFRLMVNTHVPPETAGREIAVGDPIEIIGSRTTERE